MAWLSSGSGVVQAERALIDGELRPATIRFEDGVICDVSSSAPTHADLQLGDDAILLPGLVDPHVHINEPGRTHWEGFATATLAAAKGGITTLVDMPLNSIPATVDRAALLAKRTAAQGKCRVDVGFWGGLVPGNDEELETLATEGVLGFKAFLVDTGVEEFEAISVAGLRQAAPLLAKLQLPLLVHAELEGPLLAAQQTVRTLDPRRYATYLASRPDTSELSAIRQIIELAEETGIAAHIVHLATARALSEIRDAKSRGVRLTVETAPHYLALSAEEIPDGATAFKCAPPIREQRHQDGLWQGLLDGTIDFIATDHSPCPPSDKRPEEGDFLSCWGGVASLELSLAVVWTAMRARKIAPTEIGEWMSRRPAAFAGLGGSKGRLDLGYDADMIAWFPEDPFEVDPQQLAQRHPVTPYVGRTLFGRVDVTLLRGRAVWAHGQPTGDPVGRLLTSALPTGGSNS